MLVSLTMDKSPKQNLIPNLAADAGLTAEPGSPRWESRSQCRLCFHQGTYLGVSRNNRAAGLVRAAPQSCA